MGSLQEPSVKILVVDDDPICLTVMAKGLEKAGHEVIRSPSARDAIELFQSGNPGIELVVTDLMMPGVDGFDLLRHLRGDERLKALPVIVCTAMATWEAVTRVAQYGVAGVLIKPLDIHKLRAQVSAVFAVERPALAELEATLSRLDVDVELYVEMLGQLLAEARSALTRMQRLLALDDRQAMADCAAGLREAAQNLGADRLGDTFAAKAAAAAAGDATRVRRLMAEVRTEMKAIEEAMKGL